MKTFRSVVISGPEKPQYVGYTRKINLNQDKEAIETQFEKLNELNDLINVFKSGKEIRHLLGMILKLGNYMNGGNRNEQQSLTG